MADSDAAVYTAQYTAQENYNQAMAYKYELEKVIKEKEELFQKYDHALRKIDMLEDMIEDLQKKINRSFRYSS
jgi:hypothetical protein